MGRRRKAGKPNPSGQVRYKLTSPTGKVSTMTRDAYEAARAKDELPNGTMVQHPTGWFVIGATVGDIFE